ncbi:MAG: hypothetical protein QT02_C0004G0070 [archaeon GW2011_AR9]|nr:MAG: hypothetical protein QT02_C0004G0070 [archaeon GW2011_AR9]MBS3120360.1 UPF0147 family protein [Candidatus Woesearchaeota archaeon]HIG93181.1 hypothetical protein [Candidatus Woesearchaeota archaeon]HIH13172.1 hypothetical protein [Candidatus Woesearchaeota archaeon]
MDNTHLKEVIEFLGQLKEDPDMSKRFKEKADQIIVMLSEGSILAVEKALLVLEELNASDLSSYHRTQVWDVISMLESSKTT